MARRERKEAPPVAAARPRVSARTREQRGAREEAILAAALDVFCDKGFATARIEDVAARAGVAKGTVYLYFPSKQALFEALVRASVAGPVAALEAGASDGSLSPRAALDRAHAAFAALWASPRRRVLALVLSEGQRFPEIAAFYHREVVSRGLAALRRLAERAAAQGSPVAPTLARHPQLMIAPAVVAIVWDALFASIDPLDGPEMLRAHFDLLARALEPT